MMIEASAIRSVTSTKLMPSAARWTAAIGISRTRPASAPDSEMAPTAEARKPRKVIAIWMVARKRLGSLVSRSATCADRLPSLTSWCSRWRLTVMRAISDAAKNPPIRIRAATMARSRTQLSVIGRQASVGVASPPARGLSSAASRVRLRRSSIARAGMPTTVLPAGTSRVTTAPAPVRAPGPMVTGCAQQRVDADEGAVADDGAVLGLAVEVRRDGAGADVDLLADLRIAQIAEVMLLGARSQAAVLELRVVHDLAAGTDAAAGADMRIRDRSARPRPRSTPRRR